MAKQLAHKKTKRLLTPTQISEQKQNVGEFTGNWQGRAYFIDVKRSQVAQNMGVEQKGEYAIKVR